MQNFLPCKSSPQNRCDVAHGNGVIYEDLANVRPRAMQQPSSIEVRYVLSNFARLAGKTLEDISFL